MEPGHGVAALRHAKTDGIQVLLKTQMHAGHGNQWPLRALEGDRGHHGWLATSTATVAAAR